MHQQSLPCVTLRPCAHQTPSGQHAEEFAARHGLAEHGERVADGGVVRLLAACNGTQQCARQGKGIPLHAHACARMSTFTGEVHDRDGPAPIHPAPASTTVGVGAGRGCLRHPCAARLCNLPAAPSPMPPPAAPGCCAAVLERIHVKPVLVRRTHRALHAAVGQEARQRHGLHLGGGGEGRGVPHCQIQV